MLKVIIVDDEARSRRILKHLIEEYCKDVVVAETVEDVLSAVKAINTHAPDIVFLDIEMPNHNGFKLLELFDAIDFDVVFTTAYQQYAMKAFKISATGYLLKPINIDELIKVVENIRVSRKNAESNSDSVALTVDDSKKKVVMATTNGLIYLTFDEVSYLKSEGRYTRIFLLDKTSHLTTTSLKECLELMQKGGFIRVHKSHMINLAYIKKYAKGRDSYIEMENGDRVDVGKNYKDDLTKAISMFLK